MQRLVNELDLNGYDDKFTLSTINGSLKARSSKFAELQIVSSNVATTIDLPEVYSVDKLPFNSSHVNFYDLQRNPHLPVVVYH